MDRGPGKRHLRHAGQGQRGDQETGLRCRAGAAQSTGCAAGALSRMGTKAAPALPILKAGLDDPDVNIRNAFDYAVKTIEAAKEEKPDEERAKRQAALLKGISAFREALPAAPMK